LLHQYGCAKHEESYENDTFFGAAAPDPHQPEPNRNQQDSIACVPTHERKDIQIDKECNSGYRSLWKVPSPDGPIKNQTGEQKRVHNNLCQPNNSNGDKSWQWECKIDQVQIRGSVWARRDEITVRHLPQKDSVGLGHYVTIISWVVAKLAGY
jgi:hypothetical protein